MISDTDRLRLINAEYRLIAEIQRTFHELRGARPTPSSAAEVLASSPPWQRFRQLEEKLQAEIYWRQTEAKNLSDRLEALEAAVGPLSVLPPFLEQWRARLEREQEATRPPSTPLQGRCPHCDGMLVVEMVLEATLVGLKTSGPPSPESPYVNPGPGHTQPPTT